VFIERMAGMFCAAVVGVVGVGGGIYAALQGHDWLGGIVASVTIGTLAVSFLHRKRP
jgi:phosphoribosylformimino-5-aminoimidazole carboxamide ribonucleotide (ProFAR) isomerase